jgi:hypothetical protein
MKKGAPPTNGDAQAMRFARGMRIRGEQLFAQLTRRTQPNPENVRTTHNTMTKVKKEDK